MFAAREWNRRLLTAAVLAGAVAVSSCASASSAQWTHPVSGPALPTPSAIFVVEPLVADRAPQGNFGVNMPAVRSSVALRILEVVRERLPTAELVDSEAEAVQRGATHLLVPVITEWKEMRTDDPVGAFILPHNSVSVTLRLVQLHPRALAGEVIFGSHARLTLNQRAGRLLGASFREVVTRLISDAAIQPAISVPPVRHSTAGTTRASVSGLLRAQRWACIRGASLPS